jgi:hypothetical protein
VLGGAVLALAGLFFFRYSIEHGLLPPWVRVVIGLASGVAGVGLSEWALRRDYATTANALAGAGVVILYAAFWAAGPLYELVPSPVAFIGLALTTAVCCALSWRHQSQVIATIGLIGGFSTPLLTSTGAERPIGLFAYVLVLDAALLALGRRQRWPSLAVLSLVGTLLYELLWVGGQMDADRLLLGIAILGVFALFFAAAAGRPADPDHPERGWRWAQAGGILLPFGFVVYFAVRADLGDDLLPIAALLCLLSAAAGFVAATQAMTRIATSAAAACVGVVAVWLATHEIGAQAAWAAVGTSAALALIFHLFVEWDSQDASWSGPAPAALVSALGLATVLLFAALGASMGLFWPWYVGWAAIAVLLVRHASFPRRAPLAAVAAGGLGFGLGLLPLVHGSAPAFPSPFVFLLTLLLTALAFQGIAFGASGAVQTAPTGTRQDATRWREHAAAGFAALALLILAVDVDHGVGAIAFLGAAILLGLLATFAATRLGGGPWSVVAVFGTALAHSVWIAGEGATALAFAMASAGVAIFTAWPFLAVARIGADAWSWRAAALAGPAWFAALEESWERLFGEAAIGLLPLLLGAITLAAAARARRVFPAEDRLQKTRLAWLLGVSLGFVTVAIPLQLDREWITVGWALEGLALVVLWERLDHPGLKYVALALFAAVTGRLVLNVEVLAYHPRGAWRIFNWVLYTYLVPAAALFLASRRLAGLEVARLRPRERRWYVREQPLGAAGLALAGLVVVFVWINLAIADWFATGPDLAIRFERLPARDLTTSIAWGLYALALLAVGVRMRSRALRWASLVLLVVTIGKVFLHDLGELGDLYRVASLLGLAVSLILVSLAYQRFVLRGRDEAGSP